MSNAISSSSITTNTAANIASTSSPSSSSGVSVANLSSAFNSGTPLIRLKPAATPSAQSSSSSSAQLNPPAQPNSSSVVFIDWKRIAVISAIVAGAFSFLPIALIVPFSSLPLPVLKTALIFSAKMVSTGIIYGVAQSTIMNIFFGATGVTAKKVYSILTPDSRLRKIFNKLVNEMPDSRFFKITKTSIVAVSVAIGSVQLQSFLFYLTGALVSGGIFAGIYTFIMASLRPLKIDAENTIEAFDYKFNEISNTPKEHRDFPLACSDALKKLALISVRMGELEALGYPPAEFEALKLKVATYCKDNNLYYKEAEFINIQDQKKLLKANEWNSFIRELFTVEKIADLPKNKKQILSNISGQIFLNVISAKHLPALGFTQHCNNCNVGGTIDNLRKEYKALSEAAKKELFEKINHEKGPESSKEANDIWKGIRAISSAHFYDKNYSFFNAVALSTLLK